MSTTPKTLGQLLEEKAQARLNQEAEWKRLAAADQHLQSLTLWTVTDLVEALTHGRVHIAPGHDPALTAPTSAEEALDLAWDLAHPVHEGETIPPGTEYLLRHGLGYNIEVQFGERRIDSIDAGSIRTLDPLSEPEPDWLDASAVTAECECSPGGRTVYVSHGGIGWTCSSCDTPYAPEDMENVTPLYPKEDTPRQRTVSFRDDKPWGTKLGGDPA